MFDIGMPLAKRVYLGLVDVEADNVVADFAVTEHKRKTDIPQTDDTDRCGLPIQFGDQFRMYVSHQPTFQLNNTYNGVASSPKP